MRKVKINPPVDGNGKPFWEPYEGYFHQWAEQTKVRDSNRNTMGIVEKMDGQVDIVPPDWIKFVDEDGGNEEQVIEEAIEDQNEQKPKLSDMEIIVRPRQEGKTTYLIKRSHETGYYIVCHNLTESQRVADEARDRGLEIPFPITFREFIEGSYHARGIKGFLIDNADLLLEQMAMVDIGAITLTDTKNLSDG